MLFKGTFNWQGIDHILYTHAPDRRRAFDNFLHQLTKILKYSYHYVFRYFMSGKDNYLIEEDKKCKERENTQS